MRQARERTEEAAATLAHVSQAGAMLRRLSTVRAPGVPPRVRASTVGEGTGGHKGGTALDSGGSVVV